VYTFTIKGRRIRRGGREGEERAARRRRSIPKASSTERNRMLEYSNKTFSYAVNI
jgi:hypothetical protein